MLLAAHSGQCPIEGGQISSKGGRSSSRTRSNNDERQVQVGRGNGETGVPHGGSLQVQARSGATKEFQNITPPKQTNNNCGRTCMDVMRRVMP